MALMTLLFIVIMRLGVMLVVYCDIAVVITVVGVWRHSGCCRYFVNG